MAFGMVCTSMGATVVQVTDANKKVSGPYTYVAVPNFNNLVLEYRHTFKPEGNFTKAYMAYIDENGNELRSFDIVGAKDADGTYQLAYTDMARLANGYRFAFFDENLEKSFVTSTLIGDLKETVNWNDAKRLNLTPYLTGKTLNVGDVIVIHCSNTNNNHAQLYWNDGSETKYGNSANSELNHGWGSGSYGGANDAQFANADGTYDFVLTSAMASAINERVAAEKEVYFTGENDIVASQVDLKVVTYTGETEVTSYDLTRTENKVSVFSELPPIPTTTLVTVTVAEGLDNGVNWSNGESGGFGLKEYLGAKTFKAGDVITVYCSGTDSKRGQLWWKDGDTEYKFANPAKSELKNNVEGNYGGADCQSANSDESYDFVLTAEMAEAMNARFKAGNEVYFNGENGIKVNKITYSEEKELAKVPEWHLLTLWTPAHDDLVPMTGFEAGIWGFAGKNKEFDDFQKWGNIEGNNFHDIKQVEEYFADHRTGWFCQERSPEYWSVIVPRFDAELGDWVVIAIDPDKGTEKKGENTEVTKLCMFQLWNIETDKDGNLVENIYKLDPDSDYPEIDVLSNWRYNDEYKYIYIKLDNEAKVNAAKNGLRFKGTNFTIHRVGWIHKTTDKIVEYTDVESRYHIHVLPEAFRKHSQWNLVNFTADECRPSKSNITDHDGGSGAHKFAETINLNFETTRNHGYKDVKVEFYTFLPNGTETPSDFPIADFIGDALPGMKMPEIKIDGENVDAFPAAGGYQPVSFSTESYVQSHYVMTVAGYETYECNRHGGDASHAVSATWYKPLSNLVRSLETYGLYVRVILTKQVEVTPAMRRAPMAIKDDVTNLNFEPLTGDLKDDYILYALPEVSEGVKLNPVLYYNRVGIANNAGIRTTTGLETIGDDTEAPVEIYNLQGIRVSEMTPGQIYIVRQGSKVEKIAR